MTRLNLFLLVATVAALAVGQVLFKLAASAMRGGDWTAWVLNRHLMAALVVYAGATAAWIALLREVPLSVAYPFAALAFFFVPVLAHYVLGEPLRWQTLAGAAIICAGLWVSSLQ